MKRDRKEEKEEIEEAWTKGSQVVVIVGQENNNAMSQCRSVTVSQCLSVLMSQCRSVVGPQVKHAREKVEGNGEFVNWLLQDGNRAFISRIHQILTKSKL